MGRALFVAALCLALLAPLSRADTFDNRPALDNYTYAVDVGTWCGKGLVERRLAVDNPLTILPVCDSQQHFLQTGKPITMGIIPSYVDMQEASNGSFDEWFASTNHPITFPMITVTGLVSSCDFPTDFFSYTPWRGLDQDGETTTDYGWRNLAVVIRRLLATAANAGTALALNGTKTLFSDEITGGGQDYWYYGDTPHCTQWAVHRATNSSVPSFYLVQSAETATGTYMMAEFGFVDWRGHFFHQYRTTDSPCHHPAGSYLGAGGGCYQDAFDWNTWDSSASGNGVVSRETRTYYYTAVFSTNHPAAVVQLYVRATTYGSSVTQQVYSVGYPYVYVQSDRGYYSILYESITNNYPAFSNLEDFVFINDAYLLADTTHATVTGTPPAAFTRSEGIVLKAATQHPDDSEAWTRDFIRFGCYDATNEGETCTASSSMSIRNNDEYWGMRPYSIKENGKLFLAIWDFDYQ